ncbi:MAG TPA: metallophosphoesterase, partial [Thermoanaerobaculia bacterium]
MIAQVLNRQFVLDQLEEVRSFLESEVKDGRRGPADPELPELETEDLQAALDHARGAQAREAAESSGQAGVEPPPPDRRGPEPAPLDDLSFFARDATLSNLQSALEQYLTTRQADDVKTEEDDGRRSDDGEVAVTDTEISGLPLRRDDDGRRVLDQFSVLDIRWVSSLFAMGVRRFRKRVAWNPEPAPPLPIDGRARLVVVGDWGSGIPRAKKVAAEMRKVLDEGKGNREQHVIHLGDVYYSGWEYEYRSRLLADWPVQGGEPIGSWNLNGNHDMYAGGYAFFDTALADPRFGRQRSRDGQATSFFSLVNDHWRILGLDTSWDEHGLKDPQATWAKEELASGAQKGLLLSHHQIFSSYEPSKKEPELLTKIRPVLAGGRVRSWFWGHEHRCVLYDAAEGVAAARCVGHGGVPVYRTHADDEPVPPPGFYEYRGFLEKGLERWALFGFAVLDFEGPEIDVRYIDENGEVHHR